MARPKQVLDRIRDFLATETAGGGVLVLATFAALIWANALPGYEAFWHRTFDLAGTAKDLRHWVNDGLMTLFFFVVGLEIKRELVVGELREPRVASLPVIAAIGGMAGPALLFLAINIGTPGMRGWAIPMATDIAFVVGSLALLGPRVPSGLKAFLLALAIVDDIGAIVVIAAVYTSGVDVAWLAGAAGCSLVVLVMRRFRVPHATLYLVPGVAMWWCVLQAHVHPTLAGVALGLITPARPVRGRNVLDDLQERIHPLSSFVVIPIFALANAGVALSSESLGRAAASRLFWGVIVGLVAGKTLGIFGSSVLAERLRLGRRPSDVERGDLFGGAILSGIGFTVALFITGLAFDTDDLVTTAKMGVLGGSIVAAIAGAASLVLANRRHGRSGTAGGGR